MCQVAIHLILRTRVAQVRQSIVFCPVHASLEPCTLPLVEASLVIEEYEDALVPFVLAFGKLVFAGLLGGAVLHRSSCGGQQDATNRNRCRASSTCARVPWRGDELRHAMCTQLVNTVAVAAYGRCGGWGPSSRH